MTRRRVLVTGLGTVNPLGCGVDVAWERLMAGYCAARVATGFDVDDLPCKVVCQVATEGHGAFVPEDYLAAREIRRFGRSHFITYALAASHQALLDASWLPTAYEDQCATGVIVGSGVGGLYTIQDGVTRLTTTGPNHLSPFFITSSVVNLAAGQISIKYQLKGPNHAVSTACSTSAHAISDAARMIMLGEADVMLAGGAEAAVGRLGIVGFAACRALATRFNDRPAQASRPFDKDRDGFIMADGASVLVLEEAEHAKRRGAKVYGELVGYGLSGDAYHITAPPQDGDGALRCIMRALTMAGISPTDIDYINAHGTSTPIGDEIELRLLDRLFGGEKKGKQPLVSSTKSSTGHLLGAAGATEAIFSLLAIQNGIVPATVNLDEPCFDTCLDLVPYRPKARDITYAMSNSFGFGGTNVSLIFKKMEA